MSLLLVVAMFASTAILGAQSPPPPAPTSGLAGTYHIVKPDGSAVIPGATVGETITENPDGSHTGEVWIDRNDGKGRIPIPNEAIHYDYGCHHHNWTSAKGGSGNVTPTGGNGDLFSDNDRGSQYDRLLIRQ